MLCVSVLAVAAGAQRRDLLAAPEVAGWQGRPCHRRGAVQAIDQLAGQGAALLPGRGAVLG